MRIWGPALFLLLVPISAHSYAGPFSLSLRLDANKVLLGLPITGQAVLTNVSAQPQVARISFAPVDDLFRLYLARPGAAFVRYEDLGVSRAVRESEEAVRPVTLQPRETLTSPFCIISPDRRRLAIRSPGTYRLIADLLDWDRKFVARSPEVRVEVVAPQGEDLQVWKAIQGRHYVAAACKWYYDIPDRFFDLARRILAEHPQTAYAPILKAALRGQQMVQQMEAETKAWAAEHNVSAEEKSEIEKQLRKLLDKFRQHYNAQNWPALVDLFAEESYEHRVWAAGGEEKQWLVEDLEALKPLGPIIAIELLDPQISRSRAVAQIKVLYQHRQTAVEDQVVYGKEANGVWKIYSIHIRPADFY